MKIRYNAPTVLSFAFLCTFILIISEAFSWTITHNWFSVPGRGDFSPANIQHWIRIFTHVIGHAGWAHLVANISIILLLGPILEDIYGTIPLLIMICLTAFITGILHAFFFSSDLLGASSVVFMMILLVSFTNFNRGEVPLSFILILVLYLGNELLEAFRNISTSGYNVSHFAHIVGGLVGSLFGFFSHGARRK